MKKSIIIGTAGHIDHGKTPLQELYAGGQSKDASCKLDLLFDTMSSYDRLVTPTATDWRQAGNILSGIRRRFGFEEIQENHQRFSVHHETRGASLLCYKW